MTVPLEAVAAALAAAVMHAVWNAALKAGGGDRLMDATLLFSFSGLIGLAVALAAPPMHAASVFWIVLTSLLHVPYVYFLVRAYEQADLGHVYTIARGLPPLLVMVLAAAALNEFPSPAFLLGVTMVSAGIIAVGVSPYAPVRGSLYAVAAALCIALYTVSDGIGVRISGSSLAYTGWVFFATALTTWALTVALRKGKFPRIRTETLWRAAAGGALSFASYALVLWAMTFAPVAAVSAFRETSVVFASLIGVFVFGEHAGARRIAGAVLVALGAFVLRF